MQTAAKLAFRLQYYERSSVKNLRDYDGQTFGQLTIIEVTEDADVSGGLLALAACSCGEWWEGSLKRLKAGKVDSCGCLPKRTQHERLYDKV